MVDISRNEELISFVLFGLADITNWNVVEITVSTGTRILVYQDLCTNGIFSRNGKSEVVTHKNIRPKKTGHQQLGSIGELTDSEFFLLLDAHDAIATDGYR